VARAERRVLCASLHVDATNTAALELYRRAGFAQDGVIDSYYGPGRHALKLLRDGLDGEAT
jgi:ribosomal protein S18 acetylase RimI-like enzyme